MALTEDLPDGSADERDLASFGYVQQLQRSMGAFSSFAIAFSLISITTGIFAGFSHGIRQFGPAVIFSWALVVVGQLLVALVIADLSARFPLSGYGYQWTSRLVNPHLGYFVGWLLLLQFLTGFPGVCTALSNEVCGYFGVASQFRPWVAVGMIAVIAFVHLFGIRLVTIVNDLGVTAEIAGCSAITILLLAIVVWSPAQDVTFLWNRNNFAGSPASLFGFASSMLMGAWCLTGFEAAADLAEETHDPCRTVPRAVLLSELSAGIGGLVMLFAIVLSISDLPAIQASDRPIQSIIESTVGEQAKSIVMPLVMLIVFVSIFACAVASMAATSRLIFSLARDNMLPGSSLLRSVSMLSHAPRAAIVVVWILSSAVILLLREIETITSVSVVAGYLGYAGILVAVLWAAKSLPAAEGSAFTLGRYRPVVVVAALIWLSAVVGSLLMVDAAATSNLIATKSTAVAVGVGVFLYMAVARPRLKRGVAGPPGPWK